MDQEGLVTGIAAGNASIIAMADADNEVWGGCNVIVMEAVIDAIEGIGCQSYCGRRLYLSDRS